ncbi:MAG TPA: hypothetical protein VNC78_08640 [Actinomycetota bacterium]|nr:hypothetical protein [Actinomycetota bacterium]
MRRRILSACLAAALASALALVPSAAPAAPAAAPAPAPHCGFNDYYLWTLHVELDEPLRATYRVGETVTFVVKVSRPAEHDPLGLGIPLPIQPDREPAPGVSMSIGVVAGSNDVFLSGGGITGQGGIARIPVKIPRYVKPGSASAWGLAKKLVHEDPQRCAVIWEVGTLKLPEAFEVVR